MEKIRYSIIIPVYNKEDYIEECILSVINQEFKNIEILLINDGSTDNSLSICRRLESYDNRIIVIDKQNSGVSDTRNIGIEKSRGEYILFLDADDIWSNDLLKLVDKYIEDYDILYFRSCRNKRLLNSESNLCVNKIESVDEVLKSVIYNKHLIPNCNINFNRVTDYVVSAKLLKESNLKFNRLLKVGEDKFFNFLLFQNITNIAFLNQYLYYIRTNDKSVMGSYNKSALEINENLFNVFSIAVREIEDKNIKKELEVLLDSLGFQVVWNCITSNYCHKDNPNGYKIRKIEYDECKKYIKYNSVISLNEYDKYLFKVFSYPFFFMNIIMKNRLIRGCWFYICKFMKW